jgi:hypothetical protein
MIPGVRGRLISAAFVRDLLPALPGASAPPLRFRRAIDAWSEQAGAALGPASSVRAVTDISTIPLLRTLELGVIARLEAESGCVLRTSWNGRPGPDVVVVGWSEPLSPAWRRAVLHAIAGDARWALCTNGTALRLVDARNTWAREYLEFDLHGLAAEPEPLLLLWTFIRGAAITASPPLLDTAVRLSARQSQDICRALGEGAVAALRLLVTAAGRPPSPRRAASAQVTSPHAAAGPALHDVFQHALTLMYRILFLLFAEARGLVPMWHPIYRDRYSLDGIVTALLANQPYRGLWHAVQAISRLAHNGCAAGDLKVNAFNGRLFSVTGTSALDRRPVADQVMASAIAAVSTRAVGRSGVRGRILYRDLDVEQLGAVYEQILEYQPAGDAAPLVRSRDLRKSSGSFYTPRPVTEFLVRSTLAPLVQRRTAEEILSLRIVDPAMGSGAFLVASCRYLAMAAEDALVREGRWHRGDVTGADRVALRREIALRCLYGVDLNPMAVQLARLSLWLTTLAADRPLSFLDHHLVAGDSLVGARPEDLLRRPGRVAGRRAREEALPLFESDELESVLRAAVRARRALSFQPDDTAQIVREKELTLSALAAEGTPLERWSRLLDLWCAGWFWSEGAPPDRRLFGELGDRILRGRSSLPETLLEPFLTRSAAVAREHRFLHWPLAFPEVFSGEQGEGLASPGFDALVGNPPWDMVRGDSGAGDQRTSRRSGAKQLTGFVREAGVYRVETRAHVNRYQLFVERALQLVRPGGRIGLVLPSGIASDIGTAALRRHLFDRAQVDAITGLDNRSGIFPIHRSVRFVLLTCTPGQPTAAIACRFGVSHPGELNRREERRPGLAISRRLLARLSGDDDLGIPEIASGADLRIVERLHGTIPWLGAGPGWNVRFGRELNATDDRARFRPFTGRAAARPVVEGRQVEPFRVALDKCRLELRRDAQAAPRVASHPRVAYRDVASATNRLTLIAAIVPGGAVTTHTLFCLKTLLKTAEQHVLCALLNSFVANYLLRLRVNTHVTVALVSRLPIPVIRRGHPLFARLLSLSRTLATSGERVEEMPGYAALQALVAEAYGLTAEEYEHVLSTFPLIDPRMREESLARFKRGR